MIPTSGSYFGIIPAQLVFAAVVLGFSGWATQIIITKIRYMMKGNKPANRFDRIPERIMSVIIYVFGQKRLLRDRFSGSMHFLIFWGFMVLLLQNLNFIVEGLLGYDLLPKTIYLPASLVWGIFQILVVIGVAMATYRRYIEKLPRLATTHAGSGAIVLGMIFGLMLTDFIVDGSKVSMESLHGVTASLSPMAIAVGGLFTALGLNEPVGQAILTLAWWAHCFILFYFLVYVAQSKHLHVFASPFNVFFRDLGPRGALRPIDIENADTFGLERMEDFSWKDMLDFYNCTECGRCTDVCPANLSGTPLSPKHLILEFQDHIMTQGYKMLQTDGEPREQLAKGAASEEPIWACRTCFACQAACPVFIEHVPKIIDMRRHFVLNVGAIPETAQNALVSIERRGHPWRGTQFARGDWANGLDVPEFTSGDEVEYLYWVGCTGALEERNRKVTQSVIKILQASGVSYGVLGPTETCTGDPARRMGNEYLYQMQAAQVIGMFTDKKVKKIITQCPHCFNTIKNEYPQFDGNYEVIHHSQMIAELLENGKIKLKKGTDLTGNITYHDACYLGRYNGVYDAPRDVVKSLPNLQFVEMAWNKEAGLCCGAGGGHMWMEDPVGGHVQNIRAQQAIDVAASTIATSCPFCMQMMENGVLNKNKEEEIKVRDLAELVAEAME
ncbi:MAG: 4Fe-4S dicluster domain-containing protein [Dehalococcoidia bacterium]|nr:4Fe-4S dicluster domain-containing protein [Dehalococcoidia bacterium]